MYIMNIQYVHEYNTRMTYVQNRLYVLVQKPLGAGSSEVFQNTQNPTLLAMDGVSSSTIFCNPWAKSTRFLSILRKRKSVLNSNSHTNSMAIDIIICRSTSLQCQ